MFGLRTFAEDVDFFSLSSLLDTVDDNVEPKPFVEVLAASWFSLAWLLEPAPSPVFFFSNKPRKRSLLVLVACMYAGPSVSTVEVGLAATGLAIASLATCPLAAGSCGRTPTDWE